MEEHQMTIAEARVIHYVLLDCALLYKETYWVQALDLEAKEPITTKFLNDKLRDQAIRAKQLDIRDRFQKEKKLNKRLNNEVKNFVDALPLSGKQMFYSLREGYVQAMNLFLKAAKAKCNNNHMMQTLEMFIDGKFADLPFTDPIPVNQTQLFDETKTEGNETIPVDSNDNMDNSDVSTPVTSESSPMSVVGKDNDDAGHDEESEKLP